MRSFPPLAEKGFPSLAAFALAFILTLSLAAMAQQPATGKKRVPRMTSDDVAQPAAETAGEESVKGAAKEDAGKATSKGDKPSAEEAAWRELVRQSRDKAKSLERAADQTELRVTALRNEIGRSGQTPSDRNQTAAELERAGERLLELRAQARAAAEELEQVLNEGRQKNFTEDQGPKATTGDGAPNEEYYRSRYAKLLEEAETAERRTNLYENRLRDLNQRMLSVGGKDRGDNFYIMQLQQELRETQEKLAEAREAGEKAQSELDSLMEEARRAGVPPGVFR
jgi:hypothetical protein